MRSCRWYNDASIHPSGRTSLKIELSCSQCGGNRFSLAEAAEDDSGISCEDCGETLGTLGELKRRVASRVLQKPSPAA